ncbi:MAG: hydroxyacid dehydrogenase [Myxococcales bacterium]|nr:hydroxyacid dehydrogenase [Myxococcales bacterium]
MQLVVADAFPELFLADFHDMGLEVDYRPDVKAEELGLALAKANIVVVRSKKVSRAAIEGASRLELILRAGAGVDTIDVAAASERGIYVANCPGKNSVAVAELAMGLMLSVDRRIPDGTRDLAAGKWNKKEYSKAAGLKGRTLGIAGFGAIGKEVARRALGFEMNVLAWSLGLTEDEARREGASVVSSLWELAERSDVVSVHMPQTSETKGMFGDAFFARMKAGATFINTSRGSLHDTAALLRAMKERGIKAALDVFENEPAGGTADFDHELCKVPGFVGTHHIGASTEQAQHAIAAEAVRICRTFVTTGHVPHVVNIERTSPAKVQLIVRHLDKVGVLASVLGVIKQYGLNVEEMSNTIFAGAKAAVATIRLGGDAPTELLTAILGLEEVLDASVKHL